MSAPTTLVHVTLGRTLGGLPELVRAETRALNAHGLPTTWLSLRLPERLGDISGALSDWLHDEPCADPDPAQVDALEEWAARQAEVVRPLVSRTTAVVLHDPVPAALAPHLTDAGVLVWRSHIGAQARSGHVDRAAAVLDPWLAHVDQVWMHDTEYAWPGIRARTHAVAPGLDLAGTKHRPSDWSVQEQDDLLLHGRSPQSPVAVDWHDTGGLPEAGVPFLLHASRWDPMKGASRGLRDCADVLARHQDLHYLLVGPPVRTTLLGGRNRAVLDGLLAQREALPEETRRRVHVWTFTTPAPEAQGRMLNVLRARAAVVLSPSIKEGFGLGVTEAMLHGTPVVASPVGGHLRQVESGVDGFLAEEGPAWAAAVESALGAGDPLRSRARSRARERFSLSATLERQRDLLGAELSHPVEVPS